MQQHTTPSGCIPVSSTALHPSRLIFMWNIWKIRNSLCRSYWELVYYATSLRMHVVQCDSSLGIPRVAQSGWSTNIDPIYAIQMYSSFWTSCLQVRDLSFILLDKSEVADALGNRIPNSQQKSAGFQRAIFFFLREKVEFILESSSTQNGFCSGVGCFAKNTFHVQ